MKLIFEKANRQVATPKPTGVGGLKCAIDHILEAQNKGEINEDNVLYIVENINVAGNFLSLIIFGYLVQYPVHIFEIRFS